MTFEQSIETAREERIGPNGISATALKDALAKAEGALDWLRARHADGSLPLLRLPEKQDDLAAVTAAARKLGGATDVVFLGTGGSSLGGQTLAQLGGYWLPGATAMRVSPRLHFVDNLDGDTFTKLLVTLPVNTTRYVAISKSGGTAETLMQTIAAITRVTEAKGDVKASFIGLSEPAKAGKKSGLRELLGAHGVEMLDHDPGVGGRFSVLTNVGLLPAALLGLNIGAVRRGAASALAPVLAKNSAADVPSALGAALAVALADTKKKSVHVTMAYNDRLERFTKWHVQLWAESLGKNGTGTTPVAALGPVDQHSQVQLYIGGPRDKFFTIVIVGSAGTGPRIDAELAKLAGEPGFGGKTIGDLVAAEARATAETLARNGCPVRAIHVPKLNEESLGALLMHFMLETIIAAHLWGVDAFDQPAVEEGKVLAKKYLTSS